MYLCTYLLVLSRAFSYISIYLFVNFFFFFDNCFVLFCRCIIIVYFWVCTPLFFWVRHYKLINFFLLFFLFLIYIFNQNYLIKNNYHFRLSMLGETWQGKIWLFEKRLFWEIIIDISYIDVKISITCFEFSIWILSKIIFRRNSYLINCLKKWNLLVGGRKASVSLMKFLISNID